MPAIGALTWLSRKFRMPPKFSRLTAAKREILYKSLTKSAKAAGETVLSLRLRESAGPNGSRLRCAASALVALVISRVLALGAAKIDSRIGVGSRRSCTAHAAALAVMPDYRGRGEGGLRVIPERRNRNFKLIVNRIATNAISASLSYLMAAWPVMAQQPNVIIPDGRTQTQVQTAGAVTNITTATVSGVNGFNSFSRFGVGSGNTVNLQLPGGTQNLINLVHDAPAYVNGTLNAYKDGRIGGNVYFDDPYGFVVGRSGVVNVGSLTVSTPTREFVDSVISPSGQINEGAVGKLLAGTVPISPDGTIRIRGRVNAVDAVRLTGQNVFVGSGRDAVNRD